MSFLYARGLDLLRGAWGPTPRRSRSRLAPQRGCRAGAPALRARSGSRLSFARARRRGLAALPPAGHPNVGATLGTPAGHPNAVAALGTPAPRASRRRSLMLAGLDFFTAPGSHPRRG